MSKQLVISGNDDKKPAETQLSQINGDLATTAKFINSTQTTEIFSFPINSTADLATSSTSLVQINPFVIQFDSSSDNVQINLNICVSATADAYIDIQIDGTSVLNKPFLFSGTNKQALNVSRNVLLTNGGHTLKVLWKVSSGTVTMVAAGNNFIQAFNLF